MSFDLNGKYYLPAEAANRLGVTLGRVHQMLRDQTLRAVKLSGRAYLIKDSDLQNCQVTRPKPGRPKLDN